MFLLLYREYFDEYEPEKVMKLLKASIYDWSAKINPVSEERKQIPYLNWTKFQLGHTSEKFQ